MPKYNISLEFEGENPTKITGELLEAVNTNGGKLTSFNVQQTEEEKKNNMGFQIPVLKATITGLDVNYRGLSNG